MFPQPGYEILDFVETIRPPPTPPFRGEKSQNLSPADQIRKIIIERNTGNIKSKKVLNQDRKS